MLKISTQLIIPDHEVEIHAIRAQGSGGQRVNKVSSAVHLRFNIKISSLPDELKERLLALRDRRITREGIIIIKAQQHRSSVQNREEALNGLRDLIGSVTIPRKRRRPTKPGLSAHRTRLDHKSKRARIKRMRARVVEHD